jgi:3',5'-cyclic AMP phosphodiesterase CpdA
MAAGIRVLLLALLAGVPAAMPRPAAAGEALFFFIQLTDPQLGMYEEDRGFARETANLTRAVQHVNRLHPAFVVVTGDLINRSGDAAQSAEYRRIIRGIDPAIPVHNVPGNHDLGDPPTPQKLAWFRETFGPDHGAFTVQGWRFVYLNSTLLYHPSAAPQEAEKEKAWLLAELHAGREAKAGRLVLFQHHPWFVKDPAEPDGYFNAPRPLRGEFLRILRESKVRAVFAGHLHEGAHARLDGLEMVTSAPVGKPLGKEPSGLRVVWVFADHLEHRYYPLDQVPLSIPAGAGTRRRV